jgi:hypothetical protein
MHTDSPSVRGEELGAAGLSAQRLTKLRWRPRSDCVLIWRLHRGSICFPALACCGRIHFFGAMTAQMLPPSRPAVELAGRVSDSLSLSHLDSSDWVRPIQEILPLDQLNYFWALIVSAKYLCHILKYGTVTSSPHCVCGSGSGWGLPRDRDFWLSQWQSAYLLLLQLSQFLLPGTLREIPLLLLVWMAPHVTVIVYVTVSHVDCKLQKYSTHIWFFQWIFRACLLVRSWNVCQMLMLLKVIFKSVPLLIWLATCIPPITLGQNEGIGNSCSFKELYIRHTEAFVVSFM